MKPFPIDSITGASTSFRSERATGYFRFAVCVLSRMQLELNPNTIDFACKELFRRDLKSWARRAAVS